MTKLTVEGNVYYVEAEEEEYLYSNYDEAIKDVKKLLDRMDSEDILLLKMDIGSDEIEAVQVPWSEIAQELI